MKDLTTKEGRMAAITAIEKSFLEALRRNLFDVAKDAVCRVEKHMIELGIQSEKKGWKLAFASEISLYAADADAMFGRKENEINFGSSGSFTPEQRESYWRTVHAASIIKNWKVATEIINEHCKAYADLEKEIYELLNPIN